MELSFGQSNR